jgi:heptosyltransferase III
MPTWVFHRGSLGDSVLLWPMLRALRPGHGPLTLVTDGAKARLAARELGIDGLDAEQRRFSALWVGHAAVEDVAGVGRVIAFGPDAAAEPGRTWVGNARRMFPGAAVETVTRRLDRRLAIELADRFGGAPMPPARSTPGGRVVVHVGAGSDQKRWPMARWHELAGRVGAFIVLAGEVEAERFTPDERRIFEWMNGRILTDLFELTDAIRTARVFVGCDTGPTHLAAALGVPTVALFGPTEPDEWGPIGADVRVVRAPAGGMGRLECSAIISAAPALLA